MTLKQFLNSKVFKNEYKCWYYHHKFYDVNNNELSNDEYEFWDDEKYEDFINTHEYVSHETEWELGDDHEMYAYCKIVTNIK